MSRSADEKKLFLLGQKLTRLTGIDDPRRRRFHVCGGRPDDHAELAGPEERTKADPWKVRERSTLCQDAAGPAPLKRVALVCSAGRGKTTNMEWLAAQFAKEPGCRQVPLLLRLDDADDQRVLREERERGKQPVALMHRLLQLVRDANRTDGGSGDAKPDGYLAALRRLQAAGRITVLIDGLDHAMSNPRIAKDLKEMTASEQWRRCSFWIAGRPEAFDACWDKVFGEAEWAFLRVEPLAEAEVRHYLLLRAGGDWYNEFPPNSRWLLGIPRLLGLICGIIRAAIEKAPRARITAAEAVRRLDLKMEADVYHKAYFERGEYGDRDSQGLLAQGLVGEAEWIGLPKNLPASDPDYVEPSKENYGDRLQRLSAVLGAIAFEMFAWNSAAEPPEPHVSGIRLDAIKKPVAVTLVAAEQGTDAEFRRDLLRLPHLGNDTLELIFRGASDDQVHWDNRTVQTFFAAHWAMNHGTPKDLQRMKRWIVDKEDKRLSGFAEFWQFAAEMPEVDKDRWLEIFKPCYAPPEKLPDSDGTVQWYREMIYHSFGRMKKRSEQTVKAWRSLWLMLEAIGGTLAQRAIYKKIDGGWCRCPKNPALVGKQRYWMGSPESDIDRWDDGHYHEVAVAPFLLHEFPVTNEQYELFAPKHGERRDCYSNADGQPVLYVSFWDASCFALWSGTRLPSEEEWEYACRAGTMTRYAFGDEITTSQGNIGGKVGHTTAKGAYPANAWGLFDMHGNVWEWCDSRYEGEARARVQRGGSGGYFGGSCRSAGRGGRAPGWRGFDIGFRLAAVPAVGARQGAGQE